MTFSAGGIDRAFSLLVLACVGFASVALRGESHQHVIPLSQTLFDGAAAAVQPGDVIGLEAGERGPLVIRNLRGTSEKPVVVVNRGGRVRIANPGKGDGIAISQSSHFQLRGDGHPDHRYGIDVYRAGRQCVVIDGLSSDYEVCFIEVSHAGFAGFMAKTDPAADGYAHRGSFVQYNTHLHDNFAHDVPGEAFYVGNSFYASGTPDGYLPSALVGVRVYNNITLRTGREGIQVGSATEDCEIYDNTIIDSGLLGLWAQQNGLQIGEGTTGKCYGNIIINSAANGIVLLGLGNNFIYNNVIVNCGSNGIFSDNRTGAQLEGGFVRIYHNTIIHPAKHGVLTFNEVSANEFKNNLVVLANPGFQDVATDMGATVTSSHNIQSFTTEGLGFVDPARLDFRITGSSPAVDAGAPLGVDTDVAGGPRPVGAGPDVGAYEAGPLSVALYSVHPSSEVANDGEVVVSVIGGAAPYEFVWSDGVQAESRTGLSAGWYAVTVTDADGASRRRVTALVEPAPATQSEPRRNDRAPSAPASR